MEPRTLLLLVWAALGLVGCISFSSSESPSPAYPDTCQGKEAQCREICGERGVQSFSCTARPGEGVNLKCECRRPGMAM